MMFTGKMASLKLQNIAEIVGSQNSLVDPEIIINELLLDSRKYNFQYQVLFFALDGENHCGEDYIGELYEKGLRNFVVSKPSETLYPDANFLIVKDCKEALQQLASFIRNEYLGKVISVTGSNGKTIVKEWLYQILNSSLNIVKSPKSYNSQVGVPFSVWRSEKENDLGIFEAGISEPGEMAKLERILHPEIGIFTNIGSAHDKFFENREQKTLEKLRLFKDSKCLIYCEDYFLIKDAILKSGLKSEVLFSWSYSDSEAYFYVFNKSISKGQTYISAKYKGEEINICIPFSDAASIENAIHCWLCCLVLGYANSWIQERFYLLQTVAMRLELKGANQNSILINDSYNSDVESLEVALDFLDQQAKSRSKVLILSDILQSSLNPQELYSQVDELLKRHGVEEWIGIGKEHLQVQNEIQRIGKGFKSTDEFIQNITSLNWQNKAVLIKGAREFQFEKISQILETKSHETVLEIHLSRAVDNLNFFRAKLDSGVKIMAMVKAFSYGTGSFEIASLLEFHKVDYLSVAYTDEGVELRKAGISLPIMVLNVEPSSFTDIIEYNLEPEIFSFQMLEGFCKILESREEINYPIHLKLDTGMKRLGFQEDEIPTLMEKLSLKPTLKIASIFSHLAASDDDSFQEFTNGQIAKFKSMSDQLISLFNYSIDRHILNSSGISNFPNAQFSMVRLGIGLYGISPFAKERKGLTPISELYASVSQVKTVNKGEPVGYGLSYIAPCKRKIAIISLGYADGFRRSLSNGNGRVWIGSNFYPVLGRVCMDMTMVDITNSEIKEGDRVEVMGPNVSVYDLAERMDTIPYEVLTGISRRVKRVYFFE
mgnify:CR=1 FL=1